jgi:hypothetical protein
VLGIGETRFSYGSKGHVFPRLSSTSRAFISRNFSGRRSDCTDIPANLSSNFGENSPFEQIRRVNAAGNELWSSRDFAKVLGYTDYRNFEQVVDKARIACFNSGQRVDDHFVDITEMIEILNRI